MARGNPNDRRGFLAAPRTAALWVLAATIPIATAAAFVLSYRGLIVYALAGGEPWQLAYAYPLILDLPVIAGEVVLFVAAVEGKTPRRVRGYAWAVTVGFAGLSVAANAGYLPVRAGRGLPPAVLAILLGFGLGELKRQAAKHRAESAPVPQPVPVAVPPRKPLPVVREVRARQRCGQETALKAIDEVRIYANGSGRG